MSPDDATSTTTQETTEAEAPGEGESGKGSMAFLDRSGKSMDRVPVINKVPRSMRVLTVVIVLVLIIAIIAVAWPSGEKAPEGPEVVDPATLEDWDWTSEPMEGEMSEFQSSTVTLSSMMGNASDTGILIDTLEMTVTWEDEPDQTWAGRVRENSPDEFMVEIHAVAGNISEASEMVANDPGTKQGTVSATLSMSAQNYTYLLLGNTTTTLELPEGVLNTSVDLIITMGEAGDLYASGPAVFKLNDFGNAYTLTVRASGKVLPAE